jgi:NTE family protein
MNVTELRPRSSGLRTAFVLGGGGNLGAVQVGMLQAVLERGIVPDVLVGCSVGAVNAAAIAVDPTLGGVERLRETWLDPATPRVFSNGKLDGPWQLFRKGRSMVGNERLRTMLEDCVHGAHLDELPVPLHVVATSLRTGRERWFDQGSAIEAILASAALPAVLPPVEIDGEVFIDGAVVDNVPISHAVAIGAERVVVFHVGNFDRPRPQPQRPLDVLLQAFSIARNHRFESERDAAHDAELLVLPGIDPGPVRRNDFSRSSELMHRARNVAGAWLDAHPIAIGC